ncbi:MAG: hypothetical protein M1401_03345 [Chloroflexi bacterium]|nr:hypothetical protein [Chloroflexota bacterium]
MLRYKDGLSFRRESDGAVAVVVETRGDGGHVATVKEWTIDPANWVNIVAALSAEGKPAKGKLAQIHGA